MIMAKKGKIVIARYLAGDAVKELEKDFEVIMNPEIRGVRRDILRRQIQDADALITSGDEIDREMLKDAKKLKVIADAWGGRGIDREACKEKGIEVRSSRIPINWINYTEAEHALMMMMAVGRGLLKQDAFVRSGYYSNYEEANQDFLGFGLYGKMLGILGGGFWSGDELTRRARALGMTVYYWDLGQSKAVEDEGALYMEKDELIRTSDYIVVMNNQYQGYLLDEEEFSMMKPECILVNVTRGNLIHEEALVEALAKGELAGAGLDKFENEPEMNPGLEKLNNCILSPHSDGALLPERNRILQDAIEQCLEVLG